MSPADFRVVASLFFAQMRDLWPYFLAGAGFAALIKTFKWDRRIRASLVHRQGSAILIAVAAGLVSPLCSCGILPVVISLSAAGVPLPPVLALLITSPLMSPDAFIITVGQLGWEYALWKLAIAALVGLFAGFLSLWLGRRRIPAGKGHKAEKIPGKEGAPAPGFEDIVNAGCFSHNPGEGGVVDRENRFLFFLERFRDMGVMVGKYLVAALIIQSVVTYYVPANVIEPFLGRGSSLSVLFAALVAIPLPLPQVMAPVVVKGLLSSGMAPGAGMAMLIGGPVTSIPALSVLLGVYDRRAFGLYLGIGVAATLASGFLFQYLHG